MEVNVLSCSESQLEDRDYRDILEIYINGKREFIVGDGEPEDSNLSRDFNDCWKVTDLMRQAYDAGKNGEEFMLSYGDIED